MWGLRVPATLSSPPPGTGPGHSRGFRIHHALRASMGRVYFDAHVTHLEDLGVKVRVGLLAISVSVSSAPAQCLA